jgi:dephospho-CoA kinase
MSPLLSKLNRITHPWIIFDILRQLAACFLRGSEVVLLDVPLLFETKMHLICGKTIVVAW